MFTKSQNEVTNPTNEAIITQWLDEGIYIYKKYDISDYTTPLDEELINVSRFEVIANEVALLEKIQNVIKSVKINDLKKGEFQPIMIKMLEIKWIVTKMTIMELSSFAPIVNANIIAISQELKHIVRRR